MGKRLSSSSVSLFILCAILLVSGCGGGGSGSGTDSSAQPQVRFVQASPSEGLVNVLVDSVSTATVNYGAASSYITVDRGSRHIQMEPNGSSTTFLDQNISLTNGTLTTFIVSGESPNIAGITFTDENTVATTGDASIRVINAAPAMGPADVYIVPTGTSITTVSPTVANLAFQKATDYQDVAPGSYEIFLTAPGSKSSFTSTGTITLTANQIRTYIAIDSLGGGFTQLTLSDAN